MWSILQFGQWLGNCNCFVSKLKFICGMFNLVSACTVYTHRHICILFWADGASVCAIVPCKVYQVARQTPFEIVMNTCQTHIIRAINRCELKTMNRPKKIQKTKTTRRQHSEMNKKIANSYLFFMIDQ